MTQLARSASLVVVLLLALVGTALADCTWVFWRANEFVEPVRPAHVIWASPVAYPDRDSCVAVIDDALKHWETRQPGQTVERAPSGTMAALRTQSEKMPSLWTTIRLSCLPDTVDPRGPKAK